MMRDDNIFRFLVHCLAEYFVVLCLLDSLAKFLRISKLVAKTVVESFDGSSIGTELRLRQLQPSIILELDIWQDML